MTTPIDTTPSPRTNWWHVWQPHAISTRLTMAFTSLMFVVLACGSAVVFVDVRHRTDESIRSELQLRFEGLAEQRVAADSIDASPAQLRDLVDGPAQLYAPSGTRRASTRSVDDITLVTRREVRAMTRRPAFGVWHHHGRRYQYFGGRPWPNGPVVVLADDSHDEGASMQQLLRELIGGSLAVLILGTALAYWLSHRALQPVEQLRRQARALAQDGTARDVLHVPSANDEIRRLALTLNELLHRQHDLVDRERRFVTDAGHELRTPIAVLRAELELALEQHDLTSDQRATLTHLLDETQSLTDLTDRLLRLGGIRSSSIDVERVVVAPLLERVASRVARQHAAPGDDDAVRVEVAPSLAFRADAALVELAVTNLVDNAFVHGAPPVLVRAEPTAGHDGDSPFVRVTVQDSGRGFAHAFADHAFDAFSRGDTARTTRGAGLGLSIVRDIARAHGGEATIVAGQATVALTLPQA